MGFTGGCTCGAIRYEVDADPVLNALCHCTHCQTTSGGAFSVNVLIPINSLKITKGTPKTYNNPGDSGNNVVRSFCETCGSSLFSDLAANRELFTIKGGSIDQKEVIPKPTVQLFCASKQGWLDPKVFGEMPMHEKNIQ